MSRRQRNINYDDSPTYGGFQGDTFYVGEDKQKELGISQFTCPADQDLSAKQHEYFLLPAHQDDSDRFALDLFIHYKVGINNDQILCPRFMKHVFERYGIEVPEEIKDGKCPICELESMLQAKSNEIKDIKERNKYWKKNVAPLKSYYGKSYEPEPNRYLAWVRPGSNEEDEKDIQFFLMPSGVYKEGIVAKSKTRKGDRIDLADPDKPYVLFFEREGKGVEDTRYFGFGIEQYKDESGFIPMPDSWFEDVPRYTDILIFKTYDEIKDIMGDFVEQKQEEVKNDDDPETYFENDLNKHKEENAVRRRRPILDPDKDMVDNIETSKEEDKEETSSEENTKEDIDSLRERVARKRGRRKKAE